MGCGRKLAPGQWWGFCGETDMGQTPPALCTECGGEYILEGTPDQEHLVAEMIACAKAGGIKITKIPDGEPRYLFWAFRNALPHTGSGAAARISHTLSPLDTTPLPLSATSPHGRVLIPGYAAPAHELGRIDENGRWIPNGAVIHLVRENERLAAELEKYRRAATASPVAAPETPPAPDEAPTCTMSREAFIEGYCQRSGISWAELSKTQVALPCACDADNCVGWSMVSKDPRAIQTHLDLYAPPGTPFPDLCE